MRERLDFRQTRAVRLVRALVEAHDAFIRADEAQIRSYGLSAGEFDCLVTLGEEARELRMCDMAQRSLLSKSHATQIAKQLEARELIHRRRSPESEREVLVSLTPAGEQLFERIYPVHYEHLQRLFGARLTGREQDELTALLRHLTGSA